jgi:hypothetical protein
MSLHRRRMLRGVAMGIDGLDALAAASVALVGRALPPTSILRARLARDPDCVMAIVDGPAVVAHSVVYGIDAATTDALLAGVVVNGAALPLDGLTGRSPRSFYVGMVAGRGSPGVLALRLLVTHLVERRCSAPGADRLFARPATGGGQRLLDRAGFHAIGGSSEVWALTAGAWPASNRAGPDALVSRRYVANLFGGARS